MAGKGRPQKYYDFVEPYLDEIRKMALTMTEEQIATVLGVSISSLRKYKKTFPELQAALKRGRRQLVMELHSTLIKRAKGYMYEEQRITYEGVGDKMAATEKVVFKKYLPPDVAALNLALKNYDPDNWANDPQVLRLRERELALKEQAMKDDDW